MMTRMDFAPVTLAGRKIVEEVLARFPTESCEATFGNLFAWSAPGDTVMGMVEGRIVSVCRAEKLLNFPLGEFFPPARLRELAEALGDWINPVIYDVPPAYLETFGQWQDFFTAEETEDEADYIYDLAHLTALEGGKLRKKRNLIKQFQAQYPKAEVREINGPAMRDEILHLSIELEAKLRQCDFLPAEHRALIKALENFDAAGFGGIVLYREMGIPAAFSIWSRICGSLYDIHFEKADHEVKGAAQMVTYAGAEKLFAAGAGAINREQDMGEEGLRRSKHSWDPDRFFARVNLRLKA
ncbi:MAG: phosphatidylglycerol lysyltransferase domain-containing protein [Victivallaceae bacterium]|nr:phosphatidylglycerol lysyltransferase domain-containing protein [Victivallaceae bacterium]